MLHHLGMIANFEVIDESGLKAMPLLFTGLDSLQDQRSLMKNLWVTKLMKNLLLNVSTVSYLLTNNSVFVRLLRWMHSSQRTMARQFQDSFAHKSVI
jgi:hypothetical protein